MNREKFKKLTFPGRYANTGKERQEERSNMNQDAERILEEQEKENYIKELTKVMKRLSEQLEYLIEILE